DLPKFAKHPGLFVNNQFGPETLDAKSPSLLCVPAESGPPQPAACYCESNDTVFVRQCTPDTFAIDCAASPGATHCSCPPDPPCPLITKWGSSGSSPGEFEQPWGVAVDGTGSAVYVTDVLGRVQKFDPNGNFLTQWGVPYHPRDVATDGSGNVYVVIDGDQIM